MLSIRISIVLLITYTDADAIFQRGASCRSSTMGYGCRLTGLMLYRIQSFKLLAIKQEIGDNTIAGNHKTFLKE